MQMQPGNYLGQLVKGIVSESQGGKPQAAITFNVTHAAVDGQWQEIEHTERMLYLSMAGGAKPYTKKKLQTLGYESVENVDGEPRIRFAASDEAVELVCKHEPYNGETKERWDLASWGGGGAKPAGDAAAMEFAALMDD